MLVVGCMLAVGAGEASAAPLTTVRVSVPATGGQANGDSTGAVVSADGTTVAFDSTATNLSLRADTNHARDVFVRNLATGRTRRVSVSSHEQQAAGTSHVIAISRDGRRVLFDSTAPNLVPGDTNGQRDVFVRDLVSGTTRQADRDSGGARPSFSRCCPSFGLDLSASGRWVLFATGRSQPRPGGQLDRDLPARSEDTRDENGCALRQLRRAGRGPGVVRRQSGRLQHRRPRKRRLSRESFILQRHPNHTRSAIGASLGDGSTVADMAEGGRLVLLTVFSLGTDGAEVFLVDRQAHTSTRVDVSGAAPFTTHAIAQAMSGDGRFATFLSAHAGFVAGDTNGRFDVFRRDLVGATTARISLSATGGQLGHNSLGGAMTGDGGAVVFWAGDGVTPGRRQLSQRRIPPRPVPLARRTSRIRPADRLLHHHRLRLAQARHAHQHLELLLGDDADSVGVIAVVASRVPERGTRIGGRDADANRRRPR